MIQLITAALQGLASIPKILDLFRELNLAVRLHQIEQNQAALKAGFDELEKAKTPNEIAKAAESVSRAWNR